MMIINAIGVQNSFYKSKNNNINPSFGAIHPSKYFLKCEDGSNVEITSGELLKTLQRKLVGWLNKLHNDATNIMNGKSPKTLKSEKPEEKALRERLVRFFLNHDNDYANTRVVRSYYPMNYAEKGKQFILTGHSIHFVDDAAKPIGQVKGDIRAKAEILSEYYGIGNTKAKNYVHGEQDFDLKLAQKHYYESVEAYFTPKFKGKKIKYELVDAYFKPQS